MSIVVQKFGGTSLNDVNAQSLLLSQVRKAKEEGHDLVVVVSAMGRLGEPYATDTLINMLDITNGSVELKNKDLIMSCGEVISSSVISHLLNIHGMESVALTGFQAGILTDDNFNNAKILDVNTTKISKYLREGKIVVVAGFQGATKDMDITTLGRGGSDITAVTLGGFLKADRVDIFTDVPGIAVIDPKIIPSPPYIKNINYDTMYKYASHGAKVIHPKAVSVGAKYDIPIHIRTAFLHDGCTIISNKQEENKKIIGIGVDVEFDFGCISVFLDSNDVELKEKVNGCISLNTDLKLGANWYDDYLLIHVDSDRILPLTKRLYRCFDIHKLI
ncbi:aspartate kinase [Tissierella creatinophila]|uniref:Aspartokinase n=1 Tax=Tissierella creatinophila DSM 6911 TaxID=1123403 RepID=A0A1U7M7K8_TISCR|nr:aspartate kinase [Tissierella creatinophila]OLS03265.1 aspartokinase [Tissierella creatinophila DSM 6911]